MVFLLNSCQKQRESCGEVHPAKLGRGLLCAAAGLVRELVRDLLGARAWARLEFFELRVGARRMRGFCVRLMVAGPPCTERLKAQKA